MAKNIPEIYEREYDLMCIIWKYKTLKMRELVLEANDTIGWKRTTVYTMVTRLAERGVLSFENGTVTAVVKKEDVQVSRTLEHVKAVYGGEFSSLIETCLKKKKIKKADALKLQSIINEYVSGLK